MLSTAANLTGFAKTGFSDAGCTAAGAGLGECAAITAGNGVTFGTGIGTLLSKNSDLDTGVATITATSLGVSVLGVTTADTDGNVRTAPGRGGAATGLGAIATRVGSGCIVIVTGLGVDTGAGFGVTVTRVGSGCTVTAAAAGLGRGVAAMRAGSDLMISGLAASGLADPHFCSTAANISVLPCSR